MAEHSTVNRRVAGSSPAWGVFLLLGQELVSSPFLMPVSEVRLLTFFAPNCTDFLLLFEISALVLYQSFYLYM